MSASTLITLLFLFRPLPGYTQTVTIAGNHSPSAAALTGRAAADLPLTIRISFALRNGKELRRLLTDQQDPSSPHYHQWLSPAQFDHRFGRTSAEVRAVSDWLKGRGFQVADQSLRRITANATAAVAEAAFQTIIATSPDNLTFANVSDPEIPDRLAGIVGSIEGLSNTSKALPLSRTALRNFTVSALIPGLDAALAVDGLPPLGSIPIYTNGNGVGFGPQDLYAFYDETPVQNSGIDGSGSDCIALPETSDYLDSAVALFDTTFAVPTAEITRVFPEGSDPGIGPADTETLIDIEWSHTVAPGAPITVYIGAQAFALQDAIQRAVTDNTCGAISISFEYCDINPSFFTGTLDPMFAQAAAQGQSVFVSSGDTGAAGVAEPAGEIGCTTGTSRNVNEMAADPNVTSVGGTEFVPDYDTNDNDIGFVPETVWNDPTGSLAGSSGGGASAIFSKPDYQTANTPADGARDVPDVAYAASAINPGFYLGYEASNGTATVGCCVGGTSVAAPIWAGLIKLISESNGRVGNINPRLYQLGPLGDTVGIRDVTSGNNSFNGVTGFDAVPGYDQATGWGTADIATLVNSWDIGISTPTPTASPSPSPTPSPTPTASASPSPTPAPTPTAAPSPSPTPAPTPTAAPSPSPTPAPTPTAALSPSPTPAPTPTAAPSPSPTPAPLPTPAPKPLAPTISPTSINFGAERENATTASHNLTVTNLGTSPANLIISGSTISSQFSIYAPSTTCMNGKSLAAGSSCIFALRFTPTTVGNISGTLSITDNASNSPQTPSLSGFGQN